MKDVNLYGFSGDGRYNGGKTLCAGLIEASSKEEAVDKVKSRYNHIDTLTVHIEEVTPERMSIEGGFIPLTYFEE